MEGLTVVKHPLIQHKLTLIRDRNRSTKAFRELSNELGMLLCYEVTRDLPLTEVVIETPFTRMSSPKIAGKKLVLVPAARVAHVGIYRDPKTFVAVEYFFKAPMDLEERLIIVVAPILATANTAVAAIDHLRERGATEIRFVCLLASPEGVERLRGAHPDVAMWTAAIDDHLNDEAFVVPGLGDAGDRAYGTK
jgi:uracil phosphoribosyltransferase